MIPSAFDGYVVPRPGFSGESLLNRFLLQQSGIKEYKCEKGINRLVFVPHPTFREYFGFQIDAHFFITADNSSYLCPRTHAKQFTSEVDWNKKTAKGENPYSCPFCEKANEAFKQGDKEGSKKLFPKRKTAYFVIDMRSPEKMAEGIQLYIAPRGKEDGTMGVDSALRKHLNANYANIFVYVPDEYKTAHPSLGASMPSYGFVFERCGTGMMDTSYVPFGFQPSPFVILPELVAKAKTLPSVKDFMTYYPGEYLREKIPCGVATHEHMDGYAQQLPSSSPLSPSQESHHFLVDPIKEITFGLQTQPVSSFSQQLKEAMDKVEEIRKKAVIASSDGGCVNTL